MMETKDQTASVAYNVLKLSVPIEKPFAIFIMPQISGCFTAIHLADILRMLVETKQTGYLKMKAGEEEGFLAVENGTIVNARTGAYTALHALFRFVSWRDARYEFKEQAMEPDLLRDLTVYDPEVLITGIARKEEKLAA